jgi:hypothetical protein
MIWENPPEAPKKRKVLAREAAELRAHPGQWGVVDEYPQGDNHKAQVALMIRTGRFVAFRPDGAFEAVSRTAEGTTKVYARFKEEG